MRSVLEGLRSESKIQQDPGPDIRQHRSPKPIWISKLSFEFQVIFGLMMSRKHTLQTSRRQKCDPSPRMPSRNTKALSQLLPFLHNVHNGQWISERGLLSCGILSSKLPRHSPAPSRCLPWPTQFSACCRNNSTSSSTVRQTCNRTADSGMGRARMSPFPANSEAAERSAAETTSRTRPAIQTDSEVRVRA